MPPLPFLCHPCSMRLYNNLVQRCFNDCVDDFRSKHLSDGEEKVRCRQQLAQAVSSSAFQGGAPATALFVVLAYLPHHRPLGVVTHILIAQAAVQLAGYEKQTISRDVNTHAPTSSPTLILPARCSASASAARSSSTSARAPASAFRSCLQRWSKKQQKQQRRRPGAANGSLGWHGGSG